MCVRTVVQGATLLLWGCTRQQRGCCTKRCKYDGAGPVANVESKKHLGSKVRNRLFLRKKTLSSFFSSLCSSPYSFGSLRVSFIPVVKSKLSNLCVTMMLLQSSLPSILLFTTFRHLPSKLCTVACLGAAGRARKRHILVCEWADVSI